MMLSSLYSSQVVHMPDRPPLFYKPCMQREGHDYAVLPRECQGGSCNPGRLCGIACLQSVTPLDLLTCTAVVALELKWKAPKAHTLLELVYVRWGRVAHVVSLLPHAAHCCRLL